MVRTRRPVSASCSRFGSHRPRVETLEDRLPPGCVLHPLFLQPADSPMTLVAPIGSADAGCDALAPADVGPLASAMPSFVVDPQAPGGVAEAIPVAAAWTQETGLATESRPTATDALADNLTIDLNDGIGSWFGPRNATPRHLPGISGLAGTSHAQTSAAAGPNRAVPPAGPATMTTNVSFLGNVPSPVSDPANAAAALGGTTGADSAAAPLPAYPEEGTPYNPNQPLTPYALHTEAGRGGPSNRDAPTTGVVESPPEYSPTRGVLFKYSTTSWPTVVTACVAALTGDPSHDEIAYVVVTSQSQESSAISQFAAAGADLNKVQFYIHPSESVWMRDYGPHFITVDGSLAVVDSHYYPSRPNDNFMPTLVGHDDFGIPTYDMGLYYSGGNFQPGPNGSAFITSLIFTHNTPAEGFTEDYIRELYQNFQGISTLYIMPQLPTSVDSTGHIDMWMYLVNDHTVVISQFLPGSNPTAITITNDAAAYMESLGFDVYRTPAWNVGSTHYTYANAFRVNDRIFVPVYGTAIVPGGNPSYNDRDAEAMATWQAAAGPGVQIVPIQCISIIPAAGAVHCIVMQVPRYTAPTPAVNVTSPTAGEVWLGGTTHTITWGATDTDNAPIPSYDLSYSLDAGLTWQAISTTQTNSYTWAVPDGYSTSAEIRVVATSSSGNQGAGVSQSFTISPGIQHVYDFSSGAGVDKFGFGYQTPSWTSNDGNPYPVTGPLSDAAYAALAYPDATGGDDDPNRYISPTPSSNQKSTHVFQFTIGEDPASIAEIAVLWRGYAANCTQVALYVWDFAAQQWSNGQGLTGQNRYMNSWAGRRDKDMVSYIHSDFSRYVGADGTILFLHYAGRTGDRTFHDYMSVTVKQVV